MRLRVFAQLSLNVQTRGARSSFTPSPPLTRGRCSMASPKTHQLSAAHSNKMYDVAIVGAGVAGLALARLMTQKGQEVVLIERNKEVGQETSSRNSEVLHAGIYYTPGTLKARLCVQGRNMLYAYAKDKGIRYRASGKLIVAQNDAQLQKVRELLAQAHTNGVSEARLVSAEEAKQIEPAARAEAGGLYCSVTGVIDGGALLASLITDAEAGGADLLTRTTVRRIASADGGFQLDVEGRTVGQQGAAAQSQLHARRVVNCAGLAAHIIAARIEGLHKDHVPRVRYAKGNYFFAPGEHVFNGLVYPVPEDGGLGAHLTLDIDGNIKFGPDVEWLDESVQDPDELDYAVDPAREQQFRDSVEQFWPELSQRKMKPAFSGVRPKLAGPGEGDCDFVISDASVHGLPGYVGLYGIESPGLTSCLALAEHVAPLLQ